MGCDLCGKNGELIKVRIENSIMNVCKGCSEFGSVLEKVKEKEEIKSIVKEEKEIIEIIKKNYSKIIKESREKLRLKQEELAKRINEKTSVIHKLENGDMEPNLELARKLEKFLNIKLIEEYEEEGKKIFSKEGKKMTIGDLINDK